MTVWSPTKFGDQWRCKVTAKAGDEEAERWYAGSNSLQALALAVGGAGEVARVLRAVASSMTRFAIDVVAPAKIPVTAGAGFYYDMCRLIDERLKQIESDPDGMANSFKAE